MDRLSKLPGDQPAMSTGESSIRESGGGAAGEVRSADEELEGRAGLAKGLVARLNSLAAWLTLPTIARTSPDGVIATSAACDAPAAAPSAP